MYSLRIPLQPHCGLHADGSHCGRTSFHVLRRAVFSPGSFGRAGRSALYLEQLKLCVWNRRGLCHVGRLDTSSLWYQVMGVHSNQMTASCGHRVYTHACGTLVHVCMWRWHAPYTQPSHLSWHKEPFGLFLLLKMGATQTGNGLQQMKGQGRTAGLAAIQDVLGDPNLKLTQAKDVRWLSHEKSVNNLRQCLPSVLSSIEREASERSDAQAKGLVAFIKTHKFVASVYMQSDLVPHLASLSRAFQKMFLLWSLLCRAQKQ